MARKIGGIEGVLGQLVGPSSRQGSETPTPRGKEVAPKNSERREEPPVAKPETKPSRPKAQGARRGRRPGRKVGDGVLREKATLWVSAELMAEYRDWSWDERCHLGELVERALLEYGRRRRKPA